MRHRSLSIVLAVVFAASVPLYGQERANTSDPPRAESLQTHDSAGRFHLLLGTYLTAAGTDVSVSMYQIGRGAGREVGFGGWMQDSPVAFSVSKLAIGALLAYHLERVHRTRPRLAFTLLAISTGVEVALAAHGAAIKAQPR